MHKIDFFFDFETRSRLDIKQVGSVKYALHESTQATLITYCFSRTGELRHWHYQDGPLPSDLVQVINSPEQYNFIAYNIGFDYLIWMHAFASKLGMIVKNIPIENIHDAMSITNHFRCGSSLEASAKILGIPLQKHKEGRRLMLKQCKPNAKGIFPELNDDEKKHFIRYGLLDTRILREIYYRCPALPPQERWIFEWTFLRNLKGIKIDMALVDEMHDIVEKNYPMAEQQFRYFTGQSFGIKSAAKCKEWFSQYWPGIENMRKDTIRDMLMDIEGKPEHAVNALRIKEMAGSGSIAKVAVAKNQSYAGRIYQTLVHHKAQTKRFAGMGIQIHNLPRPTKTIDDHLMFELNRPEIANDLKAVRAHLQSPLQFVKNLLRRIWIPDNGLYFYCGDFSKVEPTVLYWLSGMGDLSPTAYEEMAAAIYDMDILQIGKDSEERQIGKAAVLGAGYGMGHKKFRSDVYEKTGIILSEEMAQHVIKTYRKLNKLVAEMWHALEDAFRRAIKGETTSVCQGKILVGPMGYPHKGVQIRLPSGGMLYYHNAYTKFERETMDIVTIVDGQARIDKKYVDRENIYYVGDKNGPANIKIYGGQLTEHVVSATSRELLTPSMWRLEQNGFEVLCTVHDEIWAQAEIGRDEEFKRLMIERPSWAKEIALDAGLDNGHRYLK